MESVSGQSISRGLIVREPWISLILDGGKTWELRGNRTTIRGRIGLIASGSGKVIGAVDLVDVVGPVDREILSRTVDRHQIQIDWQAERLPYSSVFAWVLREPQRFATPRLYVHRPGAVIWVRLGD
ncbi:ASCH domain-containing protein [Xanthobacter albus]|uniref:ASCH domain-containing protein n=1 Tax=Xanthobacter albus TaxID=3119929 RepID=UPI00372D6D8A